MQAARTVASIAHELALRIHVRACVGSVSRPALPSIHSNFVVALARAARSVLQRQLEPFVETALLAHRTAHRPKDKTPGCVCDVVRTSLARRN